MAESASKTEFISFKVPHELARLIEGHAKTLGVSKSAVCRMLLQTGIVPTFQIHAQR